MSYFGKVWRGEERFAIIFWGWLIALQVVLSFLSKFFHGDASATRLSEAQWGIEALKILLLVWAAAGSWRASKHIKPIWKYMTRIVLVAWFAGLAYIAFYVANAGLLGLSAAEATMAMQGIDVRVNKVQCAEKFDSGTRTTLSSASAPINDREVFVRTCALDTARTEKFLGEAFDRDTLPK